MKEKLIEEKLIKLVKLRGGKAIKLTGFIGLPDRLVLLPKGKVGFIELKASGKKPREVQKLRLNELKSLGFKTYVVDDEKYIEGVLDEIQCT